MHYERFLDSFILYTDEETLNISNFKLSSNISTFYESPPFSLDDVLNVYFDVNSSIISTSSFISTNNFENDKLIKYIHSVKISISIKIEYENCSSLNIFTLSSSFGDFITSDKKNISITVSPKLLCLWLSSDNILNLTSTYLLIPFDLTN